MVNRFCDTEIWQKDWFLDLNTKQKLLVKFLFDNCDCAGFYKISWHLLKLYFNDSEITKDDFEKIKQVKFIDDNLIFVEDFALFQCKVSSYDKLNPNNNAHKGVLKLLEKYNIFKAPNKGLVSSKGGAQEKEKEKEKDNKPTRKQIEDYCKLIAKKINVDDFINWYSANNWKDKDGMPINWQQKVLSWAKKNMPKEVPKKEIDGWSL